LATCSVWIALDAANRENGCLRFIPGSHRNRELAQHNVNNDPNLSLPLELTEGSFDESTAVDVILEPGQISLHDIFLYHGSDANTSKTPRRGMTLRYMPTSSVYRRDLARTTNGRLAMSERTLYLMRGSDVSGQNDFRVRF
jgi:ectoine hydroxylase-related dioxygenase (phytanoyl-CoA dioxygenase family)